MMTAIKQSDLMMVQAVYCSVVLDEIIEHPYLLFD
jgi:hypothetical protein